MSTFKIPAPKPNLSRNGFDLSTRRIFSAPCGALLPVLALETNPGEHFEISVQDLVRTLPMNTAAFLRCKEYYHFFFVPYKALWRFSDQFFTGVSNGDSAFSTPVIQDSPNFNKSLDATYNFVPNFTPNFKLQSLIEYVFNPKNSTRSDSLGYKYSDGAFRLLNFLGYGVNHRGLVRSSVKVGAKYVDAAHLDFKPNPFRLLAYQRIYNDFYRNDNWEQADVVSFNVDYCNSNSNLTIAPDIAQRFCQLRYRQYPKDMFTCALPTPNYDKGIFNLPTYLGESQNVGRDSMSTGILIENDSNSTISVNDIRAMFALDKMLEVTRRANGLDYSNQIAAHFGFNVPESRRNCAQFIGGFDNAITVSEVITSSNGSIDGTNETASVTGDIYGKGIGSMNSGKIEYDTKEHGIIMCIYSNAPQVDYNAFRLDSFNRKISRSDYFQPEFQNLGMVPLLGMDMSLVSDKQQAATLDLNNAILGYVPRYIEYKTNLDLVFGDFMSGQEFSAWCTPRSDVYDYLSQDNKSPSINATTLMVDPKVLDPVFASQYRGEPSQDQFKINCYFDIKAVRPMSVSGFTPI